MRFVSAPSSPPAAGAAKLLLLLLVVLAVRWRLRLLALTGAGGANTALRTMLLC